MDEGAITSFVGLMTGEAYVALTQHTIIGRLMKLAARHSATSFERGMRYWLDAPARLLNRLFSARTLCLFDQLSAEALRSYVSGIPFGSDIGGARAIGGQVGSITDVGSAGAHHEPCERWHRRRYQCDAGRH